MTNSTEKEEGLTSRSMMDLGPATTVDVPLCPLCGKELILRIDGESYHCDSCRYSWHIDTFHLLQNLAGDAMKWRSMIQEQEERQMILFDE